MVRNATMAMALRLDFGEVPGRAASGQRNLRLATTSATLRGPDKYRLLDLKRRRAQIRARRALGLSD
jgi:hypothetical protein